MADTKNAGNGRRNREERLSEDGTHIIVNAKDAEIRIKDEL